MTKRQPKMKTLASPAPPTTKPPPGQAEAPAKLAPLIVRLVEWRKTQGLTQKETAARLDINFDTYKSYEIGHRNPNGPSTQKILALIGALK